jgi:hypothetical protein
VDCASFFAMSTSSTETTATTALEWPRETKDLIMATVGKGLDASGLRLLQHVSLSKGLDPLQQEIYAIPKGGRVTMVVSIHGMFKLCAPELDGVDCVWFDDEGNPQSVWIQDGSPKGCQVTVWRKGCSKPFTAAVRYSDFAAGGMWAKMGSVMIRKVATAHALRIGFADMLGGVYEQSELDQAGMEAPATAAEMPPLQQQQQPVKKRGTTARQSQDIAGAAKASSNVAQGAPKPDPAQNLAAAMDGQVVGEESAGGSLDTAGQPSQSDPKSAAPVGSNQNAAESDSAQSTALDQIRQAPERDAGSEPLPDRDDLTAAVAALYKKAQKVGLNRRGWATMVQIMGGNPIDPARAMGAAKGLSDAAKVAALNDGKTPQKATA